MPALRPRTAGSAAVIAAGLLLTTGCGPEDPGFAAVRQARAAATAPSEVASGAPAGGSSAAALNLPYNMAPLLKPKQKYLGVSLDGVPKSMDPFKRYSDMIGKQPNVLEYYAAWGDGFDTTGARRIYEAGALPFMSWEPHSPSMAAIAAGETDDYVRGVARDVAKLNLPIAISIAHEMNGDWYPWGRQQASPEDFVAVWKRVHDLFAQAGATNVIWVWSPNIIIPAPNTRLKPYFPGETYVDWIGMTGYFTLTGPKTFDALYGSTIKEIRAFSRKPFFISETASEGEKRRLADMDQLFDGLETNDDVVGFVWFNLVKRADWRIESSAQSLNEYKKRVSDARYGFDIRSAR